MANYTTELDLLKAVANSDGNTDKLNVNVTGSVTAVGGATEAKQDTGNTSLASIDTKLSTQATAAKQDIGNTSLSSIDTKLSLQATATNQSTQITSLASIDSKLHALGQTTMAASMPVTLASDQTPLPDKTQQSTLSGNQTVTFICAGYTTFSFQIEYNSNSFTAGTIDVSKTVMVSPATNDWVVAPVTQDLGFDTFENDTQIFGPGIWRGNCAGVYQIRLSATGVVTSAVIDFRASTAQDPYALVPDQLTIRNAHDVTQGSTTSGQLGPLVQGATTTAAPSYTTAKTNPLSLDTSGNLRVIDLNLSLPQASTTSGQVGPLVQTATTTAAPTYTTAKTNPLSTDTAGNLRVSLAGTAANGTAIKVDGSAVIQPVSLASGALTIGKAEDTASADLDVGVPAMAIRKAAPANTSSTDGDYEMLQISAGRLWVDPSGVTLTVGSHAVTVASGGIASGALASGSVASGALAAGSVSAGALASGSVASGALASGSIASGAVASGAFASGSISAGAVAAGASSFVKLEDAASADADAGVPAMAIRKATPGNTSGTDGDYEMLQVSAGRVWTSANIDQINGVTPLMGNGTTGTGSPRVTIASDNTAFAVNSTIQTGSNQIGHLEANQSVNNAQINGVTPLMGNGTTGTGSQRVTIASDNTAFSVNATPPALTKGTQGSTGYSVQMLRDAGRSNINLYASGVASGTTGTETAITLTKSAGTAATSSAASFVVTNGKIFRITNIIFGTRGNATGTAEITTFVIRVNTGGAVTTSSTPVVLSARSGAAATALAYDRIAIPLTEGYEITGDGTLQFGVTANSVFTTNAPAWDVLITGYEY